VKTRKELIAHAIAEDAMSLEITLQEIFQIGGLKIWVVCTLSYFIVSFT